MVIRPSDASGDVLPVLSSADLLRGAPAAARLVRCRLELLTGDWWENPARGNEIVELLRESRITEADTRALASYLSSYIRETPGVREVRDVRFSADGRQIRYACTVDTDAGSAVIQYEF